MAGLGAVVACSGPVQVTVPTPSGDAVNACVQVMSALPRTVVDQSTVDTQPSSPLTAAWGDPAIVLRCGVPQPAAMAPTSQLVTVNGVDWFPEPATNGYRFTTVGRATNVEVLVPHEYSPEVDALVDLTTTVKDNDPG